MSSANRSVLIVDDSSMVRRYYREALTRHGFRVDEALNGLEALEKLLLSPVDLLLVDINMPKMDGLSFLKAVRNHSQEISDIPAIVISTEAAQTDADAASTAGANFYLVKPIAQDLLVQYARILTGAPE